MFLVFDLSLRDFVFLRRFAWCGRLAGMKWEEIPAPPKNQTPVWYSFGLAIKHSLRISTIFIAWPRRWGFWKGGRKLNFSFSLSLGLSSYNMCSCCFPTAPFKSSCCLISPCLNAMLPQIFGLARLVVQMFPIQAYLKKFLSDLQGASLVAWQKSGCDQIFWRKRCWKRRSTLLGSRQILSSTISQMNLLFYLWHM